MLRSRIPQIVTTIEITIQDVIETGAELVKRDAKARVPVDTGDLRDAIHVEPDDGEVYVVAGDTEAFYGHIVEHGSSHSPPHPFLVPALEENRDTITGIARARLRGL